jgi:hypothetical protein
VQWCIWNVLKKLKKILYIYVYTHACFSYKVQYSAEWRVGAQSHAPAFCQGPGAFGRQSTPTGWGGGVLTGGSGFSAVCVGELKMLVLAVTIRGKNSPAPVGPRRPLPDPYPLSYSTLSGLGWECPLPPKAPSFKPTTLH